MTNCTTLYFIYPLKYFSVKKEWKTLKVLLNTNVPFAMKKTMNEFHVYKYLMNVKIALLHMNLE